MHRYLHTYLSYSPQRSRQRLATNVETTEGTVKLGELNLLFTPFTSIDGGEYQILVLFPKDSRHVSMDVFVMSCHVI